MTLIPAKIQMLEAVGSHNIRFLCCNQPWRWIKIHTLGCYMVLHAASYSKNCYYSKHICYDSQCLCSNWIFRSKYYSSCTSMLSNSFVPIKTHHAVYTIKACWLKACSEHVWPLVGVTESAKCEVQIKTWISNSKCKIWAKNLMSKEILNVQTKTWMLVQVTRLFKQIVEFWRKNFNLESFLACLKPGLIAIRYEF